MRDKMIEDLEKELEVLMESWKLAMSQAINLIEHHAGRQVSTHLGHNLGNRAAELSELAAKIDQTQKILAYIRSGE
jgi:hypothetical protein